VATRQGIRPVSDGAPLGPEQRAALEEAAERARAIVGAAKIATFNGWSIGFFAVVSLLFGLFSLTSLVIGIGLAIVARNEFKGGAAVRALNPEGPELLWRNQVGFMSLIGLYCLWSIYQVTANPDPQMVELTDLLGGDTQELVQQLSVLLYVAVLVVTGIFQGLNARYYHRRVAMLNTYLVETPSWIIDVQRSSSLG